MQTLKEVQEFLNNIPDINCGGCGVSALAMYRWLKKRHKGKNLNFVMVFDTKADYKDNYLAYKGKEKPFGSTHVILEQNGVFFDSSGNTNPFNFGRYFLKLKSPRYLIRALNNRFGWNPDFNRKYINEIEETIRVNLSDIVR